MRKIPQHIKDKLIIGLDVAETKTAESLVKALGDEGSFYKIGYQLAFCGGLELARELVQSGKKVFLDLKLLDIENTITKAVETIVNMDMTMLTIHAYPQAMRAAVKAAEGSPLCLLGVSVLTSMDEQDLLAAGYSCSPEALVLQRAQDAKLAKMGGVVASAQEAHNIRQAIGEEMAVVTPGIRLNTIENDDQKRVLTPRKALIAGASHLVVARPIIKAEDPLEATFTILEEMEEALNPLNTMFF